MAGSRGSDRSQPRPRRALGAPTCVFDLRATGGGARLGAFFHVQIWSAKSSGDDLSHSYGLRFRCLCLDAGMRLRRKVRFRGAAGIG